MLVKQKKKYLNAYRTKAVIWVERNFIANYILSLNRQVLKSLQQELRKDMIFRTTTVGKYPPFGKEVNHHRRVKRH